MGSESTVLLFVDNSNIFISAKDEASRREGSAAKSQVRLQFDNLLKLALAGRSLAKAFVVGSIPPEQRELWMQLEEATGVRPELYERGQVSGGEQGLDQCLQVHMLRAISDYSHPQIAVLMTGDGAGYDDGVGFHADMERLHAAGWGIEVVSWLSSCRRTLREWATEKGVFIPLAARGGTPRRAESGEAPAWQGATREHIGHIRPRNNAVQAGCIAARMQRGFRHGLLG